MITEAEAAAEDIEPISERARAADVAEVWAGSRGTVAAALAEGLRTSTLAYTFRIDGRPVAMVGVRPYSELGAVGVVWMLGTSDLDRMEARRGILELAPAVIARLRRRYPRMLFNFVDAANVRAVRFLRWAGFTLQDAIPAGRGGEPFHPFYLMGSS